MALVTATEVRVGKGRDKEGRRVRKVYPAGTPASKLPKAIRDQLRASGSFISEERWIQKQIAAGLMDPEEVFAELDELDELEDDATEDDEAE